MNKKGFAISTIMYSILILFIVLLANIMGTLATRKTLLDKSKKDVISFLNASESTITAVDEKVNVQYQENNRLPGIFFDTNSTSIECTIDGEIYTNTKILEEGEYEVTCTIVYEDIKYASASTTIIVEKNVFDFQNFDYTGTYQEFIVPRTGYYQIETWGASGGGNNSGKGGYNSGNIYLFKDEIYYVYVGQNGAGSISSPYNGGGSGYYNYRNGGGATDIRYFSTTPSSSELEWNSALGLNSRIMVASGGAGNDNGSYVIGHGGGLIGVTGYDSDYPTYNATGGTQTSGGVVNNASSSYSAGTNGTFGIGGTGGAAGITSNGMNGGSYGGGAGYYGGAGGSRLSAGAWPGGGGSSYISGYLGSIAIANSSLTNNPRTLRNDLAGTICTATSALSDITCSYHYSGKVFTSTEMKAGNETMPTHDGTDTMIGNSGNGYAKVTWVGEKMPTGTTFFTSSYSYAGAYKTFITPLQGYYKIDLWGAQGGYSSKSKGAYTSGIIELETNEILYVYVGQGLKSTENSASFNGGTGDTGGTPGGGATDIRCFSDSNGKCISNSANLSWKNALGFNSRIMVAAGSGSGYGNSNINLGAGGVLIGVAGGGTNGGTQVSAGGRQTTSYAVSGFGFANGGCAGGGGYYGGGASTCANGAGGGSSYISGYLGCVAIANSSLTNNPRTTRNDSTGALCTATSALSDITCSYHYSGKIFTSTVMNAGNEAMPTHDGTSTMIGNSGHGYANITYLGKTIPEN